MSGSGATKGREVGLQTPEKVGKWGYKLFVMSGSGATKGREVGLQT